MSQWSPEKGSGQARRVKIKAMLKGKFIFSLQDTMVSLAVIAGAASVCFVLRSVDDGDIYVSMIFVLAVFLISWLTDGYLYGSVTSVLAVLLVNYVFTYPYYEFNMSISGYPLTFVSMIIVSLMTSTMTARLKEQEKLRAETDRVRMRANLLRAISHDLRTPLTSIIGAISTVLEHDEELEREEEAHLLKDCKEEAEWLVRMVENLLSVTKISSGGAAQLRKKPEMVEEIVAEAVQKFKRHFPEEKVKVKVPEELLMVPMDALLIKQVISNLLSNAALHSGAVEPTEVSVYQKRNRVWFSVRDYGHGLTDEEWERMSQGDFNRSGQQGDGSRGMGIGLSVCDTIVRAHQGELEAGNVPGGGAQFRFWLPAGEAQGEGDVRNEVKV